MFTALMQYVNIRHCFAVQQPFSNEVIRWPHRQSCCTSSLVGTEMCDHLHLYHLRIYLAAGANRHLTLCGTSAFLACTTVST